MTTTTESKPRRLFTLASGGWVVLAALLLTISAAVYQVVLVLGNTESRAVGDGTNPDTYGFDLDNLIVDRGNLTGSGAAKNQMRVLHEPVVVDAGWVDEYNDKARGNFLVSRDVVVGVSVGGETRAYPVRMLHWHEIVNDVVGGTPIVVTWSPWSGGVAVYSRRLAGEELVFGFSGLLHDSGQVLYDRRPAASDETDRAEVESLWLSLDGRAISGPAADAGKELQRLPCAVTTWAEWRMMHPRTTVLDPTAPDCKPYLKRNYKSNPYGIYVNNDARIDYAKATSPLPESDTLPLKTPLFILDAGDVTKAYAIPLLHEAAGDDHLVSLTVGEIEVEVKVTDRPTTAYIDPEHNPGVGTRYAYWFAYYAANDGDVELAQP